jgi:glycine/D-amino acid oxidase-like deaminating enzyme/nitrite reductase/ring-hydroxylating ferredoxin subunit
MNASLERSRSVWGTSADAASASPLPSDRTTGVAVVGAGIAGLSTAYELAQSGEKVVVIDRGLIGGGMTARTTAHLASELDDYYHVLIDTRGIEAARQVCRAQIDAINRIEAIIREEGIACDFRRLDGYLFQAVESDGDVLAKEYEAARRVGLDVDWAEAAPLPAGPAVRCLRFANQARFHPLKYLDGLIRCLERDGAELYSGTTVNEVAEQDDGFVAVRAASGHTVRARACVVTTNSPFNEVQVHFKQAPYRTYAVAGRVSRGSVEDALFWDTLDPYHYVRLQPADDGASDWLISGGEDHKTGEADDMEERFERLEAWTRTLFPGLGRVEHRWSGQVLEPVDHAAFIGRSTDIRNVYFATGDSGQGMTNGVAASLIISELIRGREVVYAQAHDPHRAVRGGVKEFIVENLDAVGKLVERVRPADVSDPEQIKPGEGAIVRQGLKKLAVYRDESGVLHSRSAECTHAGCIVRWNSFERCWDCPCHGSHFAPDGTALNGPAVEPLANGIL